MLYYSHATILLIQKGALDRDKLMLHMLKRIATLWHQKPRQPTIPAGFVIYAVGDIHGRDDLLTAFLNFVSEDTAKRDDRAKIITVFLGDYIDRGLQSRNVIDLLIGEQNRPDRHAIMLKGNHEDALLQFLGDPDSGPTWFHFGGLETLHAYDIDATRIIAAGDLDPDADRIQQKQALEHLATLLRQQLPAAHRRFLESLPLWVQLGDYVFVHAGIRPGIALNDQTPQDLLWIRDDFLFSERDFGHLIVHGHTPAPHPEICSNRINLDTGAFATGMLTCLVLDGTTQRFITITDRHATIFNPTSE